MEDPLAEVERRKKRRSADPPGMIEESKTMTKIMKRVQSKKAGVFKAIEEISAQEGRRPEDLIEEAVIHYAYERKLIRKEMTVEQLYEAWQMLKEMMGFAADMWFGFIDMMLSESGKRLLEHQYGTIREQSMIYEPPPFLENSQSPEEDDAVKRIRNMMISMIELMLKQYMYRLMEAMGMKMPKPEVKIPVEEKEIKPSELPPELRKKGVKIPVKGKS